MTWCCLKKRQNHLRILRVGPSFQVKKSLQVSKRKATVCLNRCMKVQIGHMAFPQLRMKEWRKLYKMTIWKRSFCQVSGENLWMISLKAKRKYMRRTKTIELTTLDKTQSNRGWRSSIAITGLKMLTVQPQRNSFLNYLQRTRVSDPKSNYQNRINGILIRDLNHFCPQSTTQSSQKKVPTSINSSSIMQHLNRRVAHF